MVLAVEVSNKILSSAVDNNNKMPLQTANLVKKRMKSNFLRANNNRLPSTHRFKSYPARDPNNPDEKEFMRSPPRGRNSAYEDNKTFTQMNTFGFLSNYFSSIPRAGVLPVRLRSAPSTIFGCEDESLEAGLNLYHQ